MDDLSRHLGVSKKTLYEHVENKSDLVDQAILLYIKNEKAGVTEIMKINQNPIDQMLQLLEYGTRHIRQMNPALIYDLKKYYRLSFDKFLKFKKEYIYSCVHQNLNQGIESGFYRGDILPEIIARIYLDKIENLVDPEIFTPGEFTYKDIFEQFIKYHMHGIVSKNGLEYIAKKDLTI